MEAPAMTPALGLVDGGELQMIERVAARLADQQDAAAVSAVAAGRTAARDVLLPPEGHDAVAAAPAFGVDAGFVEEDHDGLVSAPRRAGSSSAVAWHGVECGASRSTPGAARSPRAPSVPL